MQLRVYVSHDRLSAEGAALPSDEVLSFGESFSDNAERLLACLKRILSDGSQWIFVANDHTFVVPEVAGLLRLLFEVSPITRLAAAALHINRTCSVSWTHWELGTRWSRGTVTDSRKRVTRVNRDRWRWW
jgi:hypothetical protein